MTLILKARNVNLELKWTLTRTMGNVGRRRSSTWCLTSRLLPRVVRVMIRTWQRVLYIGLVLVWRERHHSETRTLTMIGPFSGYNTFAIAMTKMTKCQLLWWYCVSGEQRVQLWMMSGAMTLNGWWQGNHVNNYDDEEEGEKWWAACPH